MDRKVKTIVGVAVLSLLGGIVAGYVIAHRMMGEMSGMGMEKIDAPGSTERTDAQITDLERVVEVMEGLEVADRIVTSANLLLDAESKLVSSSSMQSMMRRIGMADCQMGEAYEAKMEGMDMGSMRGMEGHQGMMGMEGMSGIKGMGNMSGMEMEQMKDMEKMKRMEEMKGMEGMSGMPGMTPGSAKAVSETRKVGGYMLAFTTSPETPKAGEVLLKLKVTDQAGKPVTNAKVTFVYTMPMPGMADSKVAAPHTKNGIYEGKAMFGMGGTWVVTANVTIPGKAPITEQFQFMVAGGGM
jgi:membrane fusion protein, copper/silver efflux system